MPRDRQAVRLHVMGIAPILTTWAEAGDRSFAEIGPADFAAALQSEQCARPHFAVGLKSLSKGLKGRKLVFTNPTRGMKPARVATTLPVGLGPAGIRWDLNSPDDGDIRRICDIFGLSVEGAPRYLSTIEHPDLRDNEQTVRRT